MTQRADAEWAVALCGRIAAFTDVPGTITRTFLSAATRPVQELLRAEMQALGMTVRMDAAGNLRGLYMGDGPGVLLLGSHIDTVPDAGAYDGVLGVAIALALVRSLRGERLSYAIEVIAFSEEEGVRFGMPFIGSRAVVGALTADELARRDADGVSVAEALRGFGLRPERLADAALTPGTFAFVECHIEQGPELEAEGFALGVVGTIVGQARFELTFRGQANHAGTTPMRLRRDALAAAAGFIAAAERLALAAEGLVATVGMISAGPGAANIVPGRVSCSLDMRHASDALRERMLERLFAETRADCAKRGVEFESRKTSEQASVAMDEGLAAGLMDAAKEAGSAARPMNSGAGHDAMIVARKVPAAMLFLRTPGGVSHHPAESVAVEDVQAAIETCRRFAVRLRPA
jgi:allantoate deiminase